MLIPLPINSLGLIGMNPGKAPWLFKAKKMMEDWKGYKVADQFVLTTSNILFLLLVVERLQGS